MSSIKQTRISLRKGLKSDLPSHAPLGEPLYCTDTGEIYVGNGDDKTIQPLLRNKVAETFASIPNNFLNVGDTVTTSGFYTLHDGGSCSYIVLSSKVKSYDLPCGNLYLRPIVSGSVCPKQFGTVNDGVHGDNKGLQACFDYVRDYNIGEIDGRGLLYTTDSSTTTHSSHKGVMIHGGVKLINYNGQVSLDVTDMTSVLDLIQCPGKPYEIDNCSFNGRYGEISHSIVGREDGGRHCLFFSFLDNTFPKEYLPCSDIFIKNSSFIKPDSYGIMLSPCDCFYNVDNCKFDTNGPCVLTYSTRFEIRNCEAKINESYKLMVQNLCHDEMEFEGKYKGNKTKKFLMKSCKLEGGDSLFKIHADTQGKTDYSSIVIKDSESNSGSLTAYMGSKTLETRPEISEVSISNTSGAVTIKGFSVLKLNLDTILGTDGRIWLTDSNINNFNLSNYSFTKKRYVYLGSSQIQKAIVYKCEALEDLDPFFRAYGGGSTEHSIDNLVVDNMNVATNYRVFECCASNTIIKDLHYLAGDYTLDFLYNRKNEVQSLVIKDCILEVPTGEWEYIYINEHECTGKCLMMNILYTGKLNVLLRGMKSKKLNVVDSTIE